MNSPLNRESQLAKGWDEELCTRHCEVALEDHSYVGTKAERSTHEDSWKMVLNSSGPTGPVVERDDYEEAKRTLERLHKEQRNCNAKIQPKDQLRRRPGDAFAQRSEGIERRVQQKLRQVHLQHGEAHQNNGGRLEVGMIGRISDFSLFITEVKVLSLAGDSLVRD